MPQANTCTTKNPATIEKDETKEPSMFNVLIHNDDYTSMEFVVGILKTVFNKGPEDALSIMLRVHQAGHGVAGIYTHEIADAKITLVHQLSRQHDFPLKCSKTRS